MVCIVNSSLLGMFICNYLKLGDLIWFCLLGKTPLWRRGKKCSVLILSSQIMFFTWLHWVGSIAGKCRKGRISEFNIHKAVGLIHIQIIYPYGKIFTPVGGEESKWGLRIGWCKLQTWGVEIVYLGEFSSWGTSIWCQASAASKVVIRCHRIWNTSSCEDKS